MVLEQIVVLLVDLGPSPLFLFLLFVELEIIAPFCAIFGASAHLIFAHAWERLWS
jgi:hypothetical protein